MGRALTLLFMLALSEAQGAFEQVPRGARSLGLGGATVALEGDEWGCFMNPSCLRATTGVHVAVEYSPAQYGLWELKRGGIVLRTASPLGTVALSGSLFGFDLYREVALGIALAREVGEHAALGIGVNWYSLAIHGYGCGNDVGLDLGMWLQLARGISYGFAVRNLNRPSLGREEEALPRTFSMGIQVQPIPGAMLGMSAGKDVHHPVELAIGLEYSFEDLLIFRMGASHEPSAIAAGMGIRTSLLCVDYAFSMHPDLGGTHCLSLSFAFPWP